MTRNIYMRMEMATNLNETAFIEESDHNLAGANPRAPMETSNCSPLVGELTEGWPVVICLVEFATALGVKPRSAADVVLFFGVGPIWVGVRMIRMVVRVTEGGPSSLESGSGKGGIRSWPIGAGLKESLMGFFRINSQFLHDLLLQWVSAGVFTGGRWLEAVGGNY
ncbi:hypothetical protein Adt_12263 [Abeliophyllum distichum]|uniref:Uncharacterized protein n=1 Tax=Abeliophyllum distichum TaxID=126358 RepID=A0ABD1UQA5_9LAMI